VTAAQRPLLVTAEPDLLDDLLRLVAAAGQEAVVVPDAAGARSAWSSASLILIDAAQARGCVQAGVPRRPGVVLIGSDLDDAGIWQVGVELGAEHVVFLPDAERFLADRLADAAEGRSAGARMLGVVGGRGGAGASVLAAALAITAARWSVNTLLVDADPLGGGLDLVVGCEEDLGLRWPEIAGISGRLPGAELAASLPGGAPLALLSWDRGDVVTVPPAAMSAVLRAGRRAQDLVVVDLPRHVDDAARVALAALDVLLVVVPAEVRACASAARVAGVAREHCADLRVLVRGPSPAGLSAEAVARALGLPLAGWLRPEPALAAALERGKPPARTGRGPLAAFCRQFLAELGALPARGAA